MKFGSKSLLFLQLLAVSNPHVGLATPTLVSWGTSAPYTTEEVRHASCGEDWCIAVMMDGTLKVIGNPRYSTPPAGITNAREVSCSKKACAALLSNGTVLGWGEDSRKGARNPGITDAKFVECGASWCVAIRKDGTLVHWGETSNSYINTGSYNGITNAVSASCSNSCAILKDDGTVYTYGMDSTGAISPTLTNIKYVNCGPTNCAAIAKDGTLFSWGQSPNKSAPHVTNAVQVDCGQHSCAVVRADGIVNAWGLENYGKNAPTITNGIVVGCTANWCAAVLENGSLRSWPSPQPPSTTGMTRLTCGHWFCLAYTSDYIAGGGGDPHFFGFGETFYTWQAHCDAILLKSPQKNEDVDLEVHVRLTRSRKWSKIETLAFTSGDHLGEITSEDAKLILNGRETKKYHTDSLSISKSRIKKHIHLYKIRFPKEKTLEVKVNTRFNMIYVTTGGRYPLGTQGLLGSPHNPGLISRDGLMLSNKEVNAFGESWQVKDTDRHLFTEERSPQHPEKCLYDMKQVQGSGGRARALKQLPQISREEATKACNVHTLAPMRQFCIDDVMLTGDIEYAKDDFYG